MKTLKNLFLAFALTALATVTAFGQATLSSTTLGAAVTTTNQTTITLAATTGMSSAGPANQINTVLYVDREFMRVTTLIDSTHVVVQRAQGIGASARPATHANGAKVYYANSSVYQPTQYTINAAEYFTNGQIALESEVSGSCTATSELVLPKVYLFDGNIYDCKAGGQWILVGNGTMASPYGRTIGAFCTGQLGSAETDYLNNAACSSATSATAAYVITTPGTLANLYSSAGTNVSGGTGKDVVTVLKNGSATALTCTYATGGAAVVCSDLSHSVNVVPGDIITINIVSATSDTGYNLRAFVSEY